MLLVLIMDLLKRMRDKFRSLEIKINSVQGKIESDFSEIFSDQHEFDSGSNQIQEFLLQRDINRGWTVLEYLQELDMFTMLQINPVTRTVMSLWRSKTDIGGSIFDLATSYDLTFVN